jgi:hypothetical protein
MLHLPHQLDLLKHPGHLISSGRFDHLGGKGLLGVQTDHPVDLAVSSLSDKLLGSIAFDQGQSFGPRVETHYSKYQLKILKPNYELVPFGLLVKFIIMGKKLSQRYHQSRELAIEAAKKRREQFEHSVDQSVDNKVGQI